MGKISKNLKKYIKDYSHEVSQKIRVSKVILFGSAARGRMNKHSDIDLIVLSDDFKKMDFMDRLVLLSRTRGSKFLSFPMDILGYTPAEFQRLSKQSSILEEIRKEGKVVYP